MRKVVTLVVGMAALLGAMPYALADRWGLALACLLAGALWWVPTQPSSGFFPGLGTLSLLGLGAAGHFLGFRPEWLLGQVALALAAWDLAHFSQVSEGYEGQANQQALAVLFRAHLVRLGAVVAIGWGIGMAALYLRISLGFSGALVLVALVLLGLRQGVLAIFTPKHRSEVGLEREE